MKVKGSLGIYPAHLEESLCVVSCPLVQNHHYLNGSVVIDESLFQLVDRCSILEGFKTQPHILTSYCNINRDKWSFVLISFVHCDISFYWSSALNG